MKIVEFICSRNHHTDCDVGITNRFQVEKCVTCGELVKVWSHARFRKVQSGAEARNPNPRHVPNQFGVGDWVEARRKEVLDAYGLDYYKWNYGRNL